MKYIRCDYFAVFQARDVWFMYSQKGTGLELPMVCFFHFISQRLVTIIYLTKWQNSLKNIYIINNNVRLYFKCTLIWRSKKTPSKKKQQNYERKKAKKKKKKIIKRTENSYILTDFIFVLNIVAKRLGKSITPFATHTQSTDTTLHYCT